VAFLCALHSSSPLIFGASTKLFTSGFAAGQAEQQVAFSFAQQVLALISGLQSSPTILAETTRGPVGVLF